MGQLKMAFALWTRRAVGQLIQQGLVIEMPIRTVGLYLKRWGMTLQQTLKKTYEQNPKAVQQWLAEHSEEIAVFYLPADSPELTPDEYLNGDLKLALFL